jgi:hypothetical protein
MKHLETAQQLIKFSLAALIVTYQSQWRSDHCQRKMASQVQNAQGYDEKDPFRSPLDLRTLLRATCTYGHTS